MPPLHRRQRLLRPRLCVCAVRVAALPHHHLPGIHGIQHLQRRLHHARQAQHVAAARAQAAAGWRWRGLHRAGQHRVRLHAVGLRGAHRNLGQRLRSRHAHLPRPCQHGALQVRDGHVQQGRVHRRGQGEALQRVQLHVGQPAHGGRVARGGHEGQLDGRLVGGLPRHRARDGVHVLAQPPRGKGAQPLVRALLLSGQSLDLHRGGGGRLGHGRQR
mmetsp:Transcript_27876/g.71090  ORF Transcript_27876/g.71090 Transcript_27876/m.71090 type:complete len:216 (-) Transcript_27876:2231-2878(-)